MLNIKEIASHLLDVIYPSNCIGCSDIVNNAEKDLLCTKCMAALPETDYHEVINNAFYMKMNGRLPLVQAISLYFMSKGSVTHNIIHEIKYRGNKEYAYDLGAYYGEILKASNSFIMPDILIPVPLHKSKLSKRGFNQSEYFANGLAESLQIPLDIKSVIKGENTESQTKKSKLNRLKNVDEIFEVVEVTTLNGKHIAIVDDVMTTGATIESCADIILKNCKNVNISLITLAMVKQ
jgi:ComF family protein